MSNPKQKLCFLEKKASDDVRYQLFTECNTLKLKIGWKPAATRKYSSGASKTISLSVFYIVFER